MAQEFDLLKSLNVVVSAAPTPSRGSRATPSVDWDGRSQCSQASSVVSLSIDKLSGAVVDRIIAHARESSPLHVHEFKGANHRQQKYSSVGDGIWSECGPSAAPSVASHRSNKCMVPPPTLKHSHASSSAQSVASAKAPPAEESGTIVLHPAAALRGPLQQPSPLEDMAPKRSSCSTTTAPVAQSPSAPGSVRETIDSASEGCRHSVSSFASAHALSVSRPHSAHGMTPMSIVVGMGERQTAIMGRKVMQQSYAQDLARQIQMKSSSHHASATHSSDAVCTSLNFQPSESSQAACYPRERCPFQISKQEYKQQLLQQITDRVKARQQERQRDLVLHQNSLYGDSALEPQRNTMSSASQVAAAQTASHPLPLGVRSFLDANYVSNRGSSKARRQEYAAQLHKQIQLQQVLKSQFKS